MTRVWGSHQKIRFVPYNAKIADINESDINKHTLDLETALSETRKIIEVIIYAERVSGTGNLEAYPNEGSQEIKYDFTTHGGKPVIIADNSQRLQYSQTVANDDFDLYCLGYVVESA